MVGVTFEPLFRNPHVATIAANFWPRFVDVRRFPVEARYFDPEPGVRVLVHVQRPDQAPRGDVVLVHGLEGSSESTYMRSLAQALLVAGFTVHRTNIRTCGGTEFLCQTLYHAGFTSDLRAYIGSLGTPVWLVGFSLGANQALKLAGELGAEGPRLLRGVCAVSAPMDLAMCSRETGLPRNRVFQWHYLGAMKRRLRHRQAKLGERWISRRDLDSVRTLFEIDDRVTAPAGGFRDAPHYYATQSALRFLPDARVPILLVQAKDDPIIPFEVFSRPEIVDNPNVQLVATEHGGHIGFLARRGPRVWVDGVIVDWVGR
jgi:predicted alpha/beta-fold hydrolase